MKTHEYAIAIVGTLLLAALKSLIWWAIWIIAKSLLTGHQ